jgi:flagellar protein FliL
MSKKGLMILVVCFVIIALGVGAGLYMMWGKVSGAAPESGKGTEEVAEKEEAKVKIKALLSMETFVVNLADPGGKRYLRMTLAIELDDKDFVAEAKEAVPRMRDRVLLILPAKMFKVIRTSSGKDALRKEIIDQLNPLLKKCKITNLYFQEFVIQ